MHRKGARIALCAIVAALCVGLVGAPAADARSKKTKNVSQKGFNTAIADLKKTISGVNTLAKGGADGAAEVKGTIGAIVPVVTDALTQLRDGLTAAGAGLTAINAALQNPTTGLVGLNNARPQFGVFNAAGTIQGSTGLSGGAGPNANAAAAAGNYVVDFRNDVSKRMYSVNTFPGGDAAGIGHVVNCALAAASCNGISAGTGDVNHVLIQFGAAGATQPAAGFSVTAISG